MLTTTDSRITYIASGASPNFAVPFTFYDQEHLEIYQNGVLKTLTTHYTVTPEESKPTDPIGGTVVFVVTPPVNDIILILRHVPQTQLADLKDLSIFPADIVEQGLDLLTMQAQENRDLLGHSLSHALTIPIANESTSTLLPDPAAVVNRGRFLRVNSLGTVFEFAEVSSTPFADPLTTKGDLLAYSTQASRLPIGGTGQILDVDSTFPFGMKWTSKILTTLVSLAHYLDPTKVISLNLENIATATTQFWHARNKTITVAGTEDLPTQNPIINGAMEIWQRGTTFSAAAGGHLAYNADRWLSRFVGATAAATIRRSTDVPTIAQAGVLYNYSTELDVTTADASVEAANLWAIEQKIEGFTWRHFAQRNLILSFWVKSPKTGTHCVSFANFGSDRSYITTYTVNATDTWEQKIILIPASPSTGTWDYTNLLGLVCRWALMVGTDLHGTADVWTTNGNLYSTAAQVNVLDNTANFFRITGVRLEIDQSHVTAPSPLPMRTFAEEFTLCQRYYQKSFDWDITPIQGYGVGGPEDYFMANLAGAVPLMAPTRRFFVPMRHSISMVITLLNPAAANGQVRNVTDGTDCTASGVATTTCNGFTVICTGTAGTAVGERLAYNWTAESEL